MAIGGAKGRVAVQPHDAVLGVRANLNLLPLDKGNQALLVVVGEPDSISA